jgi:transcription-repair coupling factor
MYTIPCHTTNTITITIENKLKSQVAKNVGIELQTLEREIPLDQQPESPSSSSSKNESTIKPMNIKGSRPPSWFDDEEYNLKLMQASTTSTNKGDNEDGNDNDNTNDDNTNDNGDNTTATSTTDSSSSSSSSSSSNNKDNNSNNDLEDKPTIINGELVLNESSLSNGIRVGSAGGWSLEVFPGDFVVHRKYGIGRYEQTIVKAKTKLSKEEKETQKIRRNDIVKEMLASRKQSNMTPEEIESIVQGFGTEDDKDPISNPMQTVLEVTYGDAVVHIPVDKAYRISRYRAGDAVVKPRLSRVKGEAWKKAKKKVEEDTIQMAQDVLALYATRETLTRSPFDPTKEVSMRIFEKTFPFEPTPDQQKCFEAVENDMVWRGRPMDRLVCGDVGFGKTEVALRALFRCVANGRQAALLSPTGVLAAQHMKNVLKRMGEETEFGFNVALLRGGMGKNTKVGKAVREKIETGEVQLIVGTHALLSSGLNFKDLGLLVVDEEQRFGVKQKERLKLICDGIDVLTLSATPIPRTLQMSLSGIRDTSTIKSPPPMRKPTQTFVQEFHKDLVREAIYTELDRGGQCFYVVPRIAQLEEAEKLIKELFPEVRIIMAHGRMARGQAEDNVAAFAEGTYDVLLATTVIENGVDIPTVNTIIIQNAQAFGMSTLYQLRGRVGRSNVQAFAYFLHKEEAITEQSAMRLQAMADLHALGSGFDVANRDLEIRGAGSLLGTEQSGMAAKVGFDLYMRMLKKSIRKLRGLDLPKVPRTNIILPYDEGSLEIAEGLDGGATHAFQIPRTYIKDDSIRQKEEGEARLAENTEQLVEMTNRWKEDYGPIPARLQVNLNGKLGN